MSKKSSKKAMKPLAADGPANQSAAVYPVDEPTPNGQRAGLSELLADLKEKAARDPVIASV